MTDNEIDLSLLDWWCVFLDDTPIAVFHSRIAAEEYTARFRVRREQFDIKKVTRKDGR